MRRARTRSREGKGQKVRCEPETMETENAAVNEALRLSPWCAKMASLHEQPQQKRGAGVQPETENQGKSRQGQKTRNRDREQQRRARRDSRPPTGARHPSPGPPEEQSSANRREPDVQSVARSQELCWNAACERQPRPKRRCVCAQ